jgi:hypothetical protein
LALYARAEAVKAIDNALRECPAELCDLLIAARELILSGAPASVTLPLWDRYRNALGKSGTKPAPLLSRSSLLALVAAVDVMAKGRRGVDAVIAEVAKAAGVKHKELKAFRLRWQRGAIELGDGYNFALAGFEKMTKAEILAELKRVRKLCT